MTEQEPAAATDVSADELMAKWRAKRQAAAQPATAASPAPAAPRKASKAERDDAETVTPASLRPHDAPPCPDCGERPVRQIVAVGVTIDLKRCQPCADALAAVEREAAESERTHARKVVSLERSANITRLLHTAGFNVRDLGNASFQTFDPVEDAEGLLAAKRFLATSLDWLALDAASPGSAGPGPVLYLSSRRPNETVAPGNGKTHLQAAIARALLLDPAFPAKGVAYVFLPDYLNELRAGVEGGSYHDHIQRLKWAPVAMIDDIGAHRWNPWVIETLTDITNARLGRPTLYASNWQLDELAALAQGELRGARGTRPIYGAGNYDDEDSILDPTEAIYRLISRISARAEQITLHGRDRRPGLRAQA